MAGRAAARMLNSTMEVDLDAAACLEQALVRAGDTGGEVLSGLWYVGVIMSIFSSIASNLGVNIQKYSMIKEFKKMDADPDYRERAYIFQRIWLFGLVLVIGGSLGDFAALGFAAQTLATPVGGFTMVANVFFAHFFLKERLTLRDIIATVLVVVGVVAVAASADKSEKTYTLECLLLLYQRPVFLGYVAGVVVVIGGLYQCTRFLNKLRETEPRGARYKKWRRLHPICPAALSGVIGAQSVLFAKCSAELIKKTIAGESQFGNWQTYVIILCMFFTIFNQLHWLAAGLRYFDAVLIIPVFQCFFITGGVIGGGFFFDEFGGLSIVEKGVFTAGVSTTIFGVYLLSQRDQHPGDARVTPDGVQDGVSIINAHTRTGSGRKLGDDSDGAAGRSSGSGGRPGSASGSLSGDRPITPMPLSLQYHSLAVTDLYTAVRDNLSTPERGARLHAMAGRRRSEDISPRVPALPALPNVEETKALQETNGVEDLSDAKDKKKNANARAASSGAIDTQSPRRASLGLPTAATDTSPGPGPQAQNPSPSTTDVKHAW